jgi:hypothetical protein
MMPHIERDGVQVGHSLNSGRVGEGGHEIDECTEQSGPFC